MVDGEGELGSLMCAAVTSPNSDIIGVLQVSDICPLSGLMYAHESMMALSR